MLDIEGTSLSSEDKELLKHPLVGGLILFSRNYQSPAQLSQLVQSIRQYRSDILLAVDQEGGRVQRFREGFSAIPAMGQLQSLAASAHIAPDELAKACGAIIGYELTQLDIDISFAPVLDINGVSEVIGDRAFGSSCSEILPLASAFILGLRSMGMCAIGKHFPGHGSVRADSHIAMPVDPRALSEIESTDMPVFKQLIKRGFLQGMMPAHVIYSQVDDQPAGFSAVWLQQILRQKLGFNGVIFSDDLSMQAATVAGGPLQRAQAALQAGCDMALVCNNRDAVKEVLDGLKWSATTSHSVARLRAQKVPCTHKKQLYDAAQHTLHRATGAD
ncbi:beta-N-acetylhexosaminidase [Alteromonas flava]|uniref:beta-N-acetylhexosaminidase n=1 Tax=Alteromonas flava TaxID=2048003 RepID=UPI000C28737F|nr:beta-N-acetylhexosaminidase [Alteromonas flava]